MFLLGVKDHSVAQINHFFFTLKDMALRDHMGLEGAPIHFLLRNTYSYPLPILKLGIWFVGLLVLITLIEAERPAHHGWYHSLGMVSWTI